MTKLRLFVVVLLVCVTWRQVCSQSRFLETEGETTGDASSENPDSGNSTSTNTTDSASTNETTSEDTSTDDGVAPPIEERIEGQCSIHFVGEVSTTR